MAAALAGVVLVFAENQWQAYAHAGVQTHEGGR